MPVDLRFVYVVYANWRVFSQRELVSCIHSYILPFIFKVHLTHACKQRLASLKDSLKNSMSNLNMYEDMHMHEDIYAGV